LPTEPPTEPTLLTDWPTEQFASGAPNRAGFADGATIGPTFPMELPTPKFADGVADGTEFANRAAFDNLPVRLAFEGSYS
jgi:hypothetical protein